MIILLFIFVFGLCWFVSLSCLMVYSLLFCVCVVCDSVLCVLVVVWVSVHLDLCGPCWGLLCTPSAGTHTPKRRSVVYLGK